MVAQCRPSDRNAISKLSDFHERVPLCDHGLRNTLIGEKGLKKGAETHPIVPSLVAAKRDNSFERNGGDDGTRTRDLCRDRAAF
jgi:hypothetical protein